MNDGKKIFTNVIKGIAGGTLIAFGALSAIGFIGVASGYILSVAFVAESTALRPALFRSCCFWQEDILV